MDCPQCGTELTTYALQGHEALVCERCGYVGIEADHHGTGRQFESWHDALRRFYDESGVDSDPHVPVRPDRSAADASPSAPNDSPDPRSSPDGIPAIRPSDAADDGPWGGSVADRAATNGGRTGTDEDGSAVNDGGQESADGS